VIRTSSSTRSTPTYRTPVGISQTGRYATNGPERELGVLLGQALPLRLRVTQMIGSKRNDDAACIVDLHLIRCTDQDVCDGRCSCQLRLSRQDWKRHRRSRVHERAGLPDATASPGCR
jgi:hypothetical protein